ncbi:hypothetical protein P175DRAFT_0498267 [Aspergillus ochraceoroseus IBT 24754]|uniref:TauD/TfdA-like domain-containing protein n=1 Tax=Aspergillus ochraceoroseus IBT 24754 TaxID=1392256 RepID=A0A2T5M9F5_9EURO|nr:uncharacterized protein P175DRAFT_0498267 [Aspergillus ochraceoroseus IBT 24754]PTU25157.1 hypothetical protein P175DRAFT_0498267 [Aspergillus ochraceoroseus IBT 24754]
MEISRCGLGIQEPSFHSPTDLQGIQEAFYAQGIVFLEGFDEDSLRLLATQLGDIVQPRNEKTSGAGISNIRYEPSLSGKGYSSEELYFHTDRSGWECPPRILMSTLKSRSTTGGESLLVDGLEVLNTIKKQNGALYNLITSPEHSSFRSEDGVFVPRPIFEESSGMFRFRFDDNIQLSASLVLRFPQFLEVIYRNAYAISLEPGQGYLLDNHRFLHGRTAFHGSRELLRVLVNPPLPQSVVTILFDIDGTLCRSDAMSIDAYYSCISDVVGKPITHENTSVNLHGRTDLGLLQDILDYHGVRSKDLVTKQFLQLHPQYLQKSWEKGLASVPCAGVKETLEWLMAKKPNPDYPTPRVGLLTGNSRPNALLKLRAAGIDPSIFDLGISSFGDTHIDRISLIHDSMAKLRARDGSDLHASKVIIVGDTPLDIECAKQAGCAVVAVASGNYNMDDLSILDPDHACIQISESKAFLDSHLGVSAPMVGG